MPEQVLIDHCSPTLAGLKTGSMFPVKVEPGQDIRDELRQLNRQLRDKGLCVVMLRRTDKDALVYIYRPDHLYCCGSTGNCLVQLIRHMEEDAEFPHEVGLFLGYPPEDVRSFMEDSRRGVKCTGCWKAYGNEEEAEKTFSKFRKCTALYRRELSRGKSLAQLAVRTRNCGGRDYYNEKKGKNSYE